MPWNKSDFLLSSNLVVDFHNHFYPKSYIDELKSGDEQYARITSDERGRMLINYPGDYNVVLGPHVNLQDRISAMDQNGIDIEVLTLTTPGVEREPPERGIRLARLANDEFCDVSERSRGRFVALATLPMQTPEEATRELERAVKDRGLKGAMLFSNVAGAPLDSQAFAPVFEMAAELDIPLFIHPTSPINSASMEEYRLVPIVGFTVDTGLAVLRFVFSGMLERFENLKIVAAHTGGVFPYLRGRAEAAFYAHPECRENISKPPSHFLRKIWVDTVCYDTDLLMSTYAFSGGDKMMLGSDFPHQISDLKNCVKRVMDMKIGDEERKMILGGNAAKLLDL
jgi:aminocarboxymuconate-semialdehyde decarboxylase